MEDQTTSKKIKSIETCFDVIEYIHANPAAGVVEVANEIGISSSTAHAHLHTLKERGYLIKTDGDYRIGLPFLTVAGYIQNAGRYKKFYQVSKPEIDELAETTGERAQIMVEENNRGFYLCQSWGEQAVITDSHVGTSVSLHSTAVGKAYLAHLPSDAIVAAMDAHGLPAETDNTITTREALLDELEIIREQGVAFDRGERVVGIHCVAAPIISDTDNVLGAISVSVPKKRVHDDFFEHELPQQVSDAARVIALNVTYL
jgi:IclR family acetate operon transcriptional repressor